MAAGKINGAAFPVLEVFTEGLIISLQYIRGGSAPFVIKR